MNEILINCFNCFICVWITTIAAQSMWQTKGEGARMNTKRFISSYRFAHWMRCIKQWKETHIGTSAHRLTSQALLVRWLVYNFKRNKATSIQIIKKFRTLCLFAAIEIVVSFFFLLGWEFSQRIDSAVKRLLRQPNKWIDMKWFYNCTCWSRYWNWCLGEAFSNSELSFSQSNDFTFFIDFILFYFAVSIQISLLFKIWLTISLNHIVL